MKKYQISRDECKKNITGVCGGCGGKLVPIETVNNSGEPTYWAGCKHCGCFRSGVDEKIFKIARRLVESGEMLPRRGMVKIDYEKSQEALEYYYDCQTEALSRQISRIAYLLREDEVL